MARGLFVTGFTIQDVPAIQAKAKEFLTEGKTLMNWSDSGTSAEKQFTMPVNEVLEECAHALRVLDPENPEWNKAAEHFQRWPRRADSTGRFNFSECQSPARQSSDPGPWTACSLLPLLGVGSPAAGVTARPAQAIPSHPAPADRR